MYMKYQLEKCYLLQAKQVIKREHMIPKSSAFLHDNNINNRSNLCKALQKAKRILEVHLSNSHVSGSYSREVLDNVEYALRKI